MDSAKIDQKQPYQAPALAVLGSFETLTQTGHGHPGKPHFPWWHWHHYPKGAPGDPGGPEIFS
jgi:hypothetical protein